MNRKSSNPSRCPLCGGSKVDGTATFTAELGFGVLVVRKVDAKVCDQCGEEWIAADVARRLEASVEDARRHRRQVEVLEYARESYS